jgi:hypothetical protein
MGIEAIGYAEGIRIESVAVSEAGAIGTGLLAVSGMLEKRNADGIT